MGQAASCLRLMMMMMMMSWGGGGGHSGGYPGRWGGGRVGVRERREGGGSLFCDSHLAQHTQNLTHLSKYCTQFSIFAFTFSSNCLSMLKHRANKYKYNDINTSEHMSSDHEGASCGWNKVATLIQSRFWESTWPTKQSQISPCL